jgi:hypothetical protein
MVISDVVLSLEFYLFLVQANGLSANALYIYFYGDW